MSRSTSREGCGVRILGEFRLTEDKLQHEAALKDGNQQQLQPRPVWGMGCFSCSGYHNEAPPMRVFEQQKCILTVLQAGNVRARCWGHALTEGRHQQELLT